MCGGLWKSRNTFYFIPFVCTKKCSFCFNLFLTYFLLSYISFLLTASLFYLVSLFCSLFGTVCLLFVLAMGDHYPAREFGWTESSGSEISVGPFVEEFDASS